MSYCVELYTWVSSGLFSSSHTFSHAEVVRRGGAQSVLSVKVSGCVDPVQRQHLGPLWKIDVLAFFNASATPLG